LSFSIVFFGVPLGAKSPNHEEKESVEENETTFTIDWKGSYRIEGAAFVYRDRETGRLATIQGYPTDKLIQMR
jgi:hypothetical protein